MNEKSEEQNPAEKAQPQPKKVGRPGKEKPAVAINRETGHERRKDYKPIAGTHPDKVYQVLKRSPGQWFPAGALAKAAGIPSDALTSAALALESHDLIHSTNVEDSSGNLKRHYKLGRPPADSLKEFPPFGSKRQQPDAKPEKAPEAQAEQSAPTEKQQKVSRPKKGSIGESLVVAAELSEKAAAEEAEKAEIASQKSKEYRDSKRAKKAEDGEKVEIPAAVLERILSRLFGVEIRVLP